MDTVIVRGGEQSSMTFLVAATRKTSTPPPRDWSARQRFSVIFISFRFLHIPMGMLMRAWERTFHHDVIVQGINAVAES